MMLHIVARGRMGRGAEADLIARYAQRLAWPFRITELPDKGAGRTPAPVTPLRTIVMDEGGDQMTSMDFARLLENWRDGGVRETRFLIGAADGVSADERASADRIVAFGRATWPHMLARVMLVEQLWRATSIIAGHPYHREGQA
jgi:23S rRNA (pseudouridine1915-N3)-methyltransferase